MSNSNETAAFSSKVQTSVNSAPAVKNGGLAVKSTTSKVAVVDLDCVGAWSACTIKCEAAKVSNSTHEKTGAQLSLF